MGFLADPVGSVSDTVSHVGQVISESPIAQAAITVGGTMLGIPPSVTAGVLAANSVGQGQSLEQAAITGGLSYLGGTGINNYGATGSVFGEGGLTGLLGGTGGGAATGATAAEKAAVQKLIGEGFSSSAAWEVVNAGGAGVASTVGAGAASTAGLLSGVFGQGGLSGVFGNGSTTNPGGIFTGAGADGVMTNAEALSYGLTGGDVTGVGSGLLSGFNGAYNAVTGGGVGGAVQTGANVINGLMGGGTGAGGTSGGSPSSFDMGRMIQMGAGLAGSYLNTNAANDAASTQAQAQIRAAQIAADAAKFRPVGVTTNFGSSNFNYDTNGNLVSAGYALNPVLQGQQNQIMQSTSGLLNQYTGAQAATAPMGQAAQTAMTLGQGYLSTDPLAQAQKYMTDQQGLLAPGRAQDFAALQAQNAAQGRSGFAMGGGVNGQMAANPEMQAYWNARMQQDAQLAANATQGGMDYAKFGIGTVGSGGDMLSSMYKTQTNAASPYTTALNTANTIEGMGQNAMTLGTNLGNSTTAAAAAAGRLQGQGMTNAANTVGTQAMAAGSPWGNLLQGGANMMQQYGQPQGYQYDPASIEWFHSKESIMAEQGLFGPSPWEIQQAQGRQQYSDAADFARMNATQRGVMGMYQAGGMLGGMGAEALGMKNVAVEQAKRQEQIMGQGEDDLGTSAGMAAKAEQFRKAGDLRTATALTLKANEMKRQEAAAALAARKQETLDEAQLSTARLQKAQAEKALRENPNLKEIEVGVAGKPDYRQKVIVDTHNSAITPVKVGDPYQIAAGVRVDARGGGGGGSGTAPPKNLTREARLGWELENGMIDQATYDAAMSASPGGVLRQKQVAAADSAKSGFDAIERNVSRLYDTKTGALKPAAQSLFGQYAQHRPEISMSQESVDAKLALEGLTDQVMLANLADAKTRVGQSFGSMQMGEWDKFTQQLTSLKRGLSEDRAAEAMRDILKFIKDKRNILDVALNKSNTVSPPATKPQAPSDFNSKWAALKSGQSLVGPDGKTYTKK